MLHDSVWLFDAGFSPGVAIGAFAGLIEELDLAFLQPLHLTSFTVIDSAGFGRVVDDVRGQEDEQVLLFTAFDAVFEQPPQNRDVSQNRHLFLRRKECVIDQTADHHRAPVLHDHGGVDGALQGGGLQVKLLIMNL